MSLRDRATRRRHPAARVRANAAFGTVAIVRRASHAFHAHASLARDARFA
jgi:hypothetical protein